MSSLDLDLEGLLYSAMQSDNLDNEHEILRWS